MIHVEPRQEPKSFDKLVRKPGEEWLAKHPPSHKKKLPPYWRKGLPELRASYKGICSYFCCYVRPATGGGSTDHFVPKSTHRNLTYEWTNYRFACSRMNSRKRDASDVLDPFTLLDGHFQIYFPTMRVCPAGGLTPHRPAPRRVCTVHRDGGGSAGALEAGGSWSDRREHPGVVGLVIGMVGCKASGLVPKAVCRN